MNKEELKELTEKLLEELKEEKEREKTTEKEDGIIVYGKVLTKTETKELDNAVENLFNDTIQSIEKIQKECLPNIKITEIMRFVEDFFKYSLSCVTDAHKKYKRGK